MSSGGGLGGAAAGDLYAVLSVSPTATKADIKAAFRRLVKKLHPDINPGDTAGEDRFKRITHAYSVLGDDKKRAAYDAEHRFLHQHSYTHSHASNARDARARERAHAAAGSQAMAGDHDIHDHFDVHEWNRAHYGPDASARARSVVDRMQYAEAHGWSGAWEDPKRNWRQNFERRRMAQAQAEALKNATKAARPARRGTHFGAVLVVGAAVALVAFDQVSKRMRAHEYARPARRAARRGDAMDG